MYKVSTVKLLYDNMKKAQISIQIRVKVDLIEIQIKLSIFCLLSATHITNTVKLKLVELSSKQSRKNAKEPIKG